MNSLYCDTVDLVIDRIALRGSQGLCLAFFLETIHAKLLIHISKQALSSRKFRFQINGLECGLENITENVIGNVVCFAPLHESLTAFGVATLEVLHPTSLTILECVGCAGATGCLLTDLSQTLNMTCKSIHDFIDKLAMAGHVVKRLVGPLIGNLRNRVTVLHLKRFAADYNPTDYNLQFIDYSVYTQVSDIIFDLLESHNIASIPMKAVGNHIGLTKRQMYNVRNYVQANGKRLDLKIKFIQTPGGLWLVSRADEENVTKSSQPFTSLRNLPLYETVAALLRESTVGVDSQMIAHSAGLNTKTANKLITEFSTVLHYPMHKSQSGKQVKHVLYGNKHETLLSVGGEPANVMDLSMGAECEIIPAVPEVAVTTPAKATAGSKTATPSSNKRGGGISEQQKIYEKMVVAYLTQFDGIVTEIELIKHIRATSVTDGTIDKKTFNRLLDRLTLEKMVVVMDLSVPKLRKRKEIGGGPGSDTENVSVVMLLSACGEDQEEDEEGEQNMELVVGLREKLIARRHSEFHAIPAVTSGARGGGAGAEDATGTATASQTPKKRGRKRKAPNQEEENDEVDEEDEEGDVETAKGTGAANIATHYTGEPKRRVRVYNLRIFELPHSLVDISQLLSYYTPPSMMVSAMNLHMNLMTTLPAAEEDLIPVPSVDTLMNLLPLKHYLITCKSTLGEPFRQELQQQAEYADMFRLQPVLKKVTLGEVLALEESLELEHFHLQLPQYRECVFLQLLFLLSLGIVRCTEASLLDELLVCLRSFPNLSTVQSIVDQVTQRQFNRETSVRLNEDVDFRIALLCALLVSHYHPTLKTESEVVSSVVDRLACHSFVMNETHRARASYKTSVYRYWRSLVVHCLSIASCEEVNTLQEGEVVFKGELEDRLAGTDRPCVHPSQKTMDDAANIWKTSSLSIPLSYMILCSVSNKRSIKRSKGKFSSNSAGLDPMDGTTDADMEIADDAAAASADEVEVIPSSEEDWTRDQDLALFAHFLHKFIFKKSFYVLPTVLQDFTLQSQTFGCVLKAGEKFSVDPESSLLSVHLPYLDFGHFHESVLSRCVMAVRPHTIAAGKNRLPFLMSTVSGIRAMCSALLCEDRASSPLPVTELAAVLRAVYECPLPRSVSSSTSSSQSLNLKTGKDILALVVQMLFEDRKERQQQCMDQLLTFDPALVAQAFRELYLWGWMRKNREEGDNNVSGFTRTELLENIFSVQLAPFFLRAGFKSPSSSSDKGSLGTHSNKYDGIQPLDIKKGMVQTYESLSLIHGIINRTTTTSITVGPDPEVSVYNQQHQPVVFSDVKATSSNSGSSRSSTAVALSETSRVFAFETRGFCCVHLNRLSMTVTALPTSAATEPSMSEATGGLVSDCIVPWKSSEGVTLPHLYQLFASKLLALLADKPGSNVTQIGASLPLLGERQVQNLLDELIVQKAVYFKVSSMSIKKKGPFHRAVNVVGEERVYFMCC